MRPAPPGEDLEWLEADGLGGYASGTASGLRTRRYHAILAAAAAPPTGRMVLVNGFDAWVTLGGDVAGFTSQRYAPGVIHPDGAGRTVSFTAEPWPTWRFDLRGAVLEQSVLVPHGEPRVVLTWRLTGAPGPATLFVRPFLSGRDHHALHHANPAFAFEPERRNGVLEWHPYPGVPSVVAATTGTYTHAPDWYRNFLYAEEHARGLDCTEDLASPGVFSFDLTGGAATMVLTARGGALPACGDGAESARDADALQDRERRRRAALGGRLARAADAYLVRGTRASVVAGYPWFADWGRDTFVALRGLCLATGRLDDAVAILLSWREALSEGMLPNRFPEGGGAPEYTSVDAALWFTVAAHDTAAAAAAAGRELPADVRRTLHDGVQAVVSAYAAGTRHGIRMDDDGLLASGAPGLQLTWMDARVGERPVTPRGGKPVEVQALWLNALSVAAAWEPAWSAVLQRGLGSFRRRFPGPAGGGLFDVVDCGGSPGATDPAVRPNQILAVGGLPLPLLEGDAAARVVAAVEHDLLTPLGLRSLAPGAPGYTGRYEGGPEQRDGAYHQGTVWPWLVGAFAEAWVRVRGGAPGARSEARERFLAPLLGHLDAAGVGHVSEIADGDAPHTPRGCPFQAWSVGEALRLERSLDGGDAP